MDAFSSACFRIQSKRFFRRGSLNGFLYLDIDNYEFKKNNGDNGVRTMDNGVKSTIDPLGMK